MAIEFDDDLSSIGPLTGSERVLATNGSAKGTTTVGAIAALAGGGGSEDWSEHPATQDVDMDGHRITGMTDPVDLGDAATKEYVDTAIGSYVPPVADRLESIDEYDATVVADGTGGVVHTAVEGPDFIAESFTQVDTASALNRITATDYSTSAVSQIGVGVGTTEGVFFSANGSGLVPLNDAVHADLPAGVDSVVHGISWAVDEAKDYTDSELASYVPPAPANVKGIAEPRTTELASWPAPPNAPGNPVSGAAWSALTVGTIVLQRNGGTGGWPVRLMYCESPGSSGGGNAVWRHVGFQVSTFTGSPAYVQFSLPTGAVLTPPAPRTGQGGNDAARWRDVGDWDWGSGNVNARSKRIESLGAPTAAGHAARLQDVQDQALAEWWTPAWTPGSNVDSVSNVECQYTRVRRAAGGSLVTLSGTITVTPTAAGPAMISAPIPVPATASSGVGSAIAYSMGPADVGSCGFNAGDLEVYFVASGSDPHMLTFSVSYRAA